MTRRIAKGSVLLVDDDLSFRETLRALLCGEYQVSDSESCELALQVLEREQGRHDVVVLDLGFGQGLMQGNEALAEIRRKWPWLPVIVITVQHEASLAVECMKLNPFDYIIKGPEMATSLRLKVAQAMTQMRLRLQNQRLRGELRNNEEALQRAPGGGDEIPQTPGLKPCEIVPVDVFIREYFREALLACNNNMSEAARRLGLSYEHYRDRLIDHGIITPEKRRGAAPAPGSPVPTVDAAASTPSTPSSPAPAAREGAPAPGPSRPRPERDDC